MVSFPGCSRRELNELALNIIKHYQPGILNGMEPFNLDGFIEVVEDFMKIDFDFTSELPAGIDGCTSTIDNKVLIRAELVDDPSNERYARSTIAHEMGHVILHMPLLRELSKDITFGQKKEEQGLNLYSRKVLKPYKDPEWQAWEFAGALLMPEPAIQAMINKGMSPSQMAGIFNVNTVFMKLRMRNLKMI